VAAGFSSRDRDVVAAVVSDEGVLLLEEDPVFGDQELPGERLVAVDARRLAAKLAVTGL
jgi:hypothetical protein